MSEKSHYYHLLFYYYYTTFVRFAHFFFKYTQNDPNKQQTAKITHAIYIVHCALYSIGLRFGVVLLRRSLNSAVMDVRYITHWVRKSIFLFPHSYSTHNGFCCLINAMPCHVMHTYCLPTDAYVWCMENALSKPNKDFNPILWLFPITSTTKSTIISMVPHIHCSLSLSVCLVYSIFLQCDDERNNNTPDMPFY